VDSTCLWRGNQHLCAVFVPVDEAKPDQTKPPNDASCSPIKPSQLARKIGTCQARLERTRSSKLDFVCFCALPASQSSRLCYAEREKQDTQEARTGLDTTDGVSLAESRLSSDPLVVRT
jgi:hypothetical protein